MSDKDFSTGPASESDRQPPEHDGQHGPIWMPARNAAEIYDVEQRTIRKWISSDRIEGRMIGGRWYVAVPREDAEKAGIDIDQLMQDFEEVGEDGTPTGTILLPSRETEPPQVDMAPMAELVADLTQQVAKSSAAAAMWQERASQLERQLETTTLALESGKIQESEARTRAEDEAREAIAVARKEAAEERDREWRAKSWWQRLMGE